MCFLASSGSLATSTPHTRTLPLVGSVNPRHIMTVLVLPAPLAPNMLNSSPGRTVRFRWSTARMPPSYSLTRSMISSTGPPGGREYITRRQHPDECVSGGDVGVYSR